ncbi:UNVERIFIED_CONTAM: hypothetical protein FKN15_074614 [Acipenser sinensis]
MALYSGLQTSSPFFVAGSSPFWGSGHRPPCGGDESELLEELPVSMQLAIAVDVNFSIVSNVELFKSINLYFSLLAASGGSRRTANVVALGFANLFILDKKELNNILVHYPDSQKVLARKGKKLMKDKGKKDGGGPQERTKGFATLFSIKPETPKLLRAFMSAKGAGGLLSRLKAEQAKTQPKTQQPSPAATADPKVTTTRGTTDKLLIISMTPTVEGEVLKVDVKGN